MKKYLTRRNIGLFLIVIAGLIIFIVRPKGKKDEVKTAQVTRKDISETLSVSGKVQAERKATLTFLSSGKLAFSRVVTGQEVKTGDWLAGLDVGDLQASERAARYNYIAADANAKQIEDQVKGHENDESFEMKNMRIAAQTARDKAYDAYLVAGRAVQNAILKAPFAGIVTDVTVSTPGDIVGVTDGVTVVDPDSVSFETEVNESDISKVKIGQEATVTVDAFPDEEFIGTVKRIGYATRIGSTGATVLPIWVTIPAKDFDRLKIGLNGDVSLLISTSPRALVLPADAVRDGEVELVDGKKVKVETGIESDTEIEIKSGLSEGDIVVIK